MITIVVPSSDKERDEVESREGYVSSVETYFDVIYEDEWFENPIVKQMVFDIDKTKVIGPHLMESPVLGPISPEHISGGVKALIMVYLHDERIYNSCMFGDNCVPWLIKLGEIVDFTLVMNHCLRFRGNNKVNAKAEDGTVLDTGDKIGDYYLEHTYY